MAKPNQKNIGYVTSAFGIQGELKIRSSTDISYFAKNEELVFKINKDKYSYLVDRSREHKGNYLVKLKDFDNINQILFLVHADVFTKRKVNLAPNEFYISDLVGLDVFIIGNLSESIGKIKGLIEVPQGFNLEIEKNDGVTRLVPFIDEFVDVIDEGIVIKPIEGLL